MCVMKMRSNFKQLKPDVLELQNADLKTRLKVH